MSSGKTNEKSALQEDLAHNAGSPIVTENLDALRGASVLVTGATGLIGSEMVRTLDCINKVHGLHMQILALVRNRKKAEDIYGALLSEGRVRLVLADLTEDSFVQSVLQEISGKPADQTSGAGREAVSSDSSLPSDNGGERGAGVHIDYIIHCAAVTTSKTMVQKPVETIVTAIRGTQNMLELARETHCRSFVYVSSMEMYGDLSVYGTDTRADEQRIGYLNPLIVRSNYPESKRMCENLCAGYVSEYGVPVKIARLAQTFGAGILPTENRVFAQFARSAMAGKDIVLHTRGLSEGNYCYTADCIRGLLTILLKGSSGEAYNVVNESTHTTIAGMAQMVADEIAGGKIHVVFDIPETNTYGYAADTKLTLLSGKLCGLGWKPEIGLPDMYRRMMKDMVR